MKPSTLPPHEELFLLINKVKNLSEKLGEEVLVPLGLTVGEYHFLRIVQNTPQTTARDIQDRLFTAAPSVAQIVAKLEQKGLLKRHRSAEDGRMMHLALTLKGAWVIRKARQALEIQIKEVRLSEKLMGSTSADLSALVSVLSSHLYEKK